jgi:hypothetical protein
MKIRTLCMWIAVIAVAIALAHGMEPGHLLHSDNSRYLLIPLAGVVANKHQQFVEDVYEGVHNLSSNALTYAITNTAPTAANSILANLTQISYTNMSSRVPTISSSSQSAGLYKLVLADLVITMSGGASPTFRYFDLYNDTPTSPADPLICWWDYGSGISLADGEQITVDTDATTGVIQHT